MTPAEVQSCQVTGGKSTDMVHGFHSCDGNKLVYPCLSSNQSSNCPGCFDFEFNGIHGQRAWDIIGFGCGRSHMTQDGPNAVKQGMTRLFTVTVFDSENLIDLYELWHCYLVTPQVLIELPVIHHNFDPFGNF